MNQGDQPDDPGPGSSENPTARFPQAGYPAQGAPGPGHPVQGPAPQDDVIGRAPHGPGPGGSAPEQFAASAAVVAGRAAQRVQRMPWQERALRLPGVLAIISGAVTLLSCLFPWWALFDRSEGSLVEYSIAPFRGVSASSGSRWSDMAAINTLSQDDLEAAQALTVSVGVALVLAALTLIAGGILVARGRMQVLGISLVLFGTVLLGYARVPSEILGNVAEATSNVTSTLGGELAMIADLVGSVVPEARFGLGLSTLALTVATLGLVVYVAMIAYRETIRIRRWMA